MTESTTLGELADRGVLYVNDGYRTKASELGDEGLPVLRVAEVRDGAVQPEFKDHVRGEFRPKMGSKTSRPDDVLITTKGTVGRAAMVSASLPEFVYSPQLCVLRVLNDQVISPRWLYAWVRSPEFQRQASVVAGQTDMAPYINLVDLRRMRLQLPSLLQQRTVAEVLGALDDKIDANERQMRICDDLVEALYARAVTDAKLYPLFEILQVDFGEPFQGDHFVAPGDGRALIRIRDLKTFESQIWTTESRPREVVVQPGDVLVGMDAEFRPTLWLGLPGVLNQRVCRVRSDVLGAAYSREALRRPLLSVEGQKSGTTVIHLNKSDLEDITIPMPSASALAGFRKVADPLCGQVIAAARESRTLRQLRDALLPPLISGELRVRDVESLVGESV